MFSADHLQYFIEGLILGLGTGASCVVFCIPVFVGLTSRNIHHLTPSLDLFFFLLGRCVSYIFVGIVVSYIGMYFTFISVFEFFSKLFIAGLLIFWGIRGFRESDKEVSKCKIKKYTKSVPFLSGILTGLSPCPPFIAGITRIFAFGNVCIGIVYFLGFYISTSLFMIPSLALGLVKYKKEVKTVVSLISIAFGIFFLFSAVFTIRA